ncbi:MAG: pilus assembly protein [Eubacteriales bacterium]|nr:pilus assembly protein [Eubacteriales bacterium]
MMAKHNHSNRWLKRRGQSLVEAAFVLPLFILVLCGILDFGWLLANQLMVNNGSRDGARYAIVNTDSTSLNALVTDRVHQNPGLESLTDVTVAITNINDGQDIEITVTKKVQVLTPLTGIFVKDQAFDLISTTVMRIE